MLGCSLNALKRFCLTGKWNFKQLGTLNYALSSRSRSWKKKEAFEAYSPTICFTNLISNQRRAWEGRRSFLCFHIFHYTYSFLFSPQHQSINHEIGFFFSISGALWFCCFFCKRHVGLSIAIFSIIFLFPSSLTIYRRTRKIKKKIGSGANRKNKNSIRRLWNLYDKKLKSSGVRWKRLVCWRWHSRRKKKVGKLFSIYGKLIYGRQRIFRDYGELVNPNLLRYVVARSLAV